MALTVKLLDPTKYQWEYFAPTEETYTRYHLKKFGSTTNFARIIDKDDHVIGWVNFEVRHEFKSVEEAQLWAETMRMVNA
jgi:hypothetical protein